jgi:tetratricopeptide (TPR) repeat protein
MSVRHALLASVCSALLAATAAMPGTAAAADQNIITQAYQALAAGDAKTAVSKYSAAIGKGGLAPEGHAGALLNRGLAYQQLGEHQLAADDYTAALRLDAMNAKLRSTALYNRGLCYQKLKQATLAIDDFTGALFLDSEFSHAYYARGNALREAGQYLFALSDFEKARRYGYPSLHFAFYGEALTLEQLKRPAEAQKALEKAIALKPDFEAARAKLAALGGTVPAQPATPLAEAPITGSLVSGEPDQVVRKPVQPEAVAPPARLLTSASAEKPAEWSTAAQATPTKKRYTDRILPEEEALKPKIVVDVTADEPQTASVEEPAPAEASPEETASIGEPEAAPEETSPESSTTEEPKGWSVQLSSERDEKDAWSKWAKLKSRHALLAKRKPLVVKADLGKKGIYYRLRLAGFGNKGKALSVCSKLKAKGLSCFVSHVEG